MKVSAIAIAIAVCLAVNTRSQTASFENQALALVQRTLASDLDAELPKLPFPTWFSQLLGPQAGVIWQLTECGEPIKASTEEGPDLCACAEVNASLPDGRKVIVAITIGTFKKGITGTPAFFHAVIERNEQLYDAPRLRDLPGMLSMPKPAAIPAANRASKRAVKLPIIRAERTKLQFLVQADPLRLALLAAPNSNLRPDVSDLEQTPPIPLKTAPTPANAPQPVPASGDTSQTTASLTPDTPSDEQLLDGKAITRVKPVYPPNAKLMNALGEVRVRITISEQGKVIEAKAITGHMALRGAAVEAAFRWVFKPTTLNGAPVKVRGILTFDFTHNSQY
ncbi:MAG TPA: TonB family protein [Blastocatellia bacterium]|nr:TonB family protein [Blastocatellia bacterium]